MSGIGLFIDGANLSISWRSISPARIDFIALRACIEDHCGDRIVEAYCFDATEDGRTNAYFKMMEKCGIRVKLYRYAYEDVYDASHQRITDCNGVPVQRRIQKGVDVGLAMHMLESRRRRNWTHLVLAAADADFAEPVQRLVESDGVALTLLGLPGRVSHALRPYANDDLDLRQIMHRIARGGTAMLRPTG
jgi:uncharacterized LabA/DUF88 family protein